MTPFHLPKNLTEVRRAQEWQFSYATCVRNSEASGSKAIHCLRNTAFIPGSSKYRSAWEARDETGHCEGALPYVTSKSHHRTFRFGQSVTHFQEQHGWVSQTHIEGKRPETKEYRPCIGKKYSIFGSGWRLHGRCLWTFIKSKCLRNQGTSHTLLYVHCKKKRWTQLRLKCWEPVGINPLNRVMICCLLWFQTHLEAHGILERSPRLCALLTAQLEAGWLSGRPTVSWWSPDLHACLLRGNPPSCPSGPGSPGPALCWPGRGRVQCKDVRAHYQWEVRKSHVSYLLWVNQDGVQLKRVW